MERAPLPPIRIDVDGVWSQEGEEITHPRLLASLQALLRREADGTYWVVDGRARVRVLPDDTPVVIRSVSAIPEGRPDRFLLHRSDGREEPLDPATLRQDGRNVLYCEVRGENGSGGWPARFTRAAYYQMARWTETDGEGWFLSVGGERFPLRRVT